MMRRRGKTKERIAIFGTGYVGLTMAAFFLKRGHPVICVDVIKDRVTKISNGRSPIYMPGLDEILSDGINTGKLMATSDGLTAARCSRMSFICVGTPSRPDGTIDLRYVRSVSKEIGDGLKGRKDFPVVVMKSTVIPLTCKDIVRLILEKRSKMKAGKGFGLVCNPEFLKEGESLSDSMNPDRIVIGSIDERSSKMVGDLYKGLNAPLILTDLTTAEMIKYAANTFLAAKVGLSNEIANICSAHGVDVYEVMKGVGLDERIGPHFLRAGAGFGGSCFPKDLKALRAAAMKAKVPLRILPSVLEQNEVQPLETVRLLNGALKGLRGRRIALLGLSFKPNTDDVRETRAVPILRALLKQGATVRIFDVNKGAMENFINHVKDLGMTKRIIPCASIEAALKGSDGAIIQTESKEFKALRPKDIKNWMRRPIIIDGRRTLDPHLMARSGIIYRGIGWKNL